MGFDLFSPIVLDIQTWASFDLLVELHLNEGLGMGHTVTISKSWSQK